MNAYILAGGQSKRMGSNKALLFFNGKTMVEHIADLLLSAGCASVSLIVKKELPLPLPQIIENTTQWHPLYGVSSALRSCADEYCLISPCDLPFVSIPSYQLLLQQQRECFFGNSNHRQPLLGIFATRRTKEAWHDAQSHKSVMSFVSNHTVIPIESQQIRNINRPTDRRDIP